MTHAPRYSRHEHFVGPHRLFVEEYRPAHVEHPEPVLAIGGAFDGSWIFARFAPVLASAGWTVFCLNPRGYYRSAWDDVASLSLEDYLADVAEARRALRLEKPVIVGYSIGGLYAQLSAQRDGAAAVVLYDPSPSRGIARELKMSPSRDFMDAHGNLPPVIQFIPSRAIVEEMWGRKVTEEEYESQLALFRQSRLSGQALRALEVDRPEVGRVEAPTLVLGIHAPAPAQQILFRREEASWYVFEGYSHGSLLVNPKADRITRMVMGWLASGSPRGIRRFFRTVTTRPEKPHSLKVPAGSFKGPHSRRVVDKPGSHLVLFSEGRMMHLRYYSGWEKPVACVADGARTLEFPMQRKGRGREEGESVFETVFEMNAGRGFFVRGENGEDRPGRGLLYRPSLPEIWLQDGRLYSYEPPGKETPPQFLETFLACPKLDHTFKLQVRLPRNFSHDKIYPVAVLNDGQNQWKNRGSHGGWHTDAVADGLIRRGLLEEIVLVGVTCHRHRNKGYLPPPLGRADLYADWLADDLLPHLRRSYPLSTNPGRIAIIGASYGANVSVYAALRRPDVFGLVGSLSFAYIKGNPEIRLIEGLHRRPFRRAYIDCGTKWAPDQPHRDDFTAITRKLIRACSDRWMTHGKDLLGLVAEGHQHNETFWRQRIGGCLRFLFKD